MSYYPVISRLSTLGLRQHQEFDYDFHDFRTDFIGESGAGKSMVADLLQLILVGSEAFESATAAMGGKRTPDGMVLKTKEGRGTDIGYAFLNVKLSESEFVVIGTYIQSAGRSTIPFVIQHGFDEMELKPLKQPLSYQDFLLDDKIIPLEELGQYLETKGFACKSWQRRRQYHKFLYQHELLALDLSENEKVLKDYATIIQSFSRGKSLETQKGSALKDFLFGDEAARRIYSNYQSSVNELQEGFEQYIRNKSDIDLITRKQRRLSQLLMLEHETATARYNSLLHDLQYTHQENENWKQEVTALAGSTRTHFNSLQILRSTLEYLEEKSSADEAAELIRYRKAMHEYTIQEKKWHTIQSVDTWLQKYCTTIDELLSVFQYLVKLRHYGVIWKDVNRILDDKGLHQLLDSLSPIQSATGLIELLDIAINNMQAEVKEKEAFQQFIDINDKGSLGRWALEQRRGFNLQEESMIMHFKELSTRKPGNTNGRMLRYIPTPEALFRSYSITEPDDAGGWLHLNGIREYIPWVEKQILSSNNQQHIQQFFEQEMRNIKEQIRRLENNIAIHKQLKKVVIDVDFDSYLQALTMSEQIIGIEQEDDFMKQSETLVKEHIAAYEAKDIVSESYADAKSELDAALENMQYANTFHSSINTLLSGVRNLLNENSWNSIWQEIFDAMLPPLENAVLAEQERTYLHASLGRQSDKVHFLEEKIEHHRKELNSFKLKDAWSKLKEAEKEYAVATSEFKKVYTQIPEGVFEDKTQRQEGAQLRISYQTKKSEFESVYRDVIDAFIQNDKYRFENIYDTTELSLTLLPAAFQGLEVTTTNMIDLIGSYLAKINDKNRELNKRKFQKINDLLDQVMDEVNDRLSMVRRIDLFLNEEGKEITGGHRVRLQSSPSKEYPVEWIDRFQAMLKDETEDLLDTKLSEGVSLEDKMVAAFYACSGSRSKPKIEKLLDPNSYFELEFSMRSESGLVNKGSNGQSYAGIALLCIARLHIIGAGVGSKGRNGIRFMPIDEAEGLGSNYDMLYNIAKQYKYQIVSFAINPLGTFTDGELYMYMLSKDLSTGEDINYVPLAIRCERDMDLLN
jgi:MukB N-terminal